MISAWPALVMVSFWERALMPMLNVVTFSLFPAPLSFMRNDPSLGLVHGACILAQRDAYNRVGGHTAVKGEIFEDQRLAQLWRERGERGFCLDGRTAVSVRMYRSLGEIWRGFQKNFYPAFQHEWSFWAYLLLHASIFIVPMILVAIAPSWTTRVGRRSDCWRCDFCSPSDSGTRLWTVLMHPVAEVVLLGIGLASWWRCRTGRGVEWKGRRYLERGAARRGPDVSTRHAVVIGGGLGGLAVALRLAAAGLARHRLRERTGLRRQDEPVVGRRLHVRHRSVADHDAVGVRRPVHRRRRAHGRTHRAGPDGAAREVRVR